MKVKLTKYIFLDFDGVLHSHSHGKSFSHLHYFHKMLKMMKTYAKVQLNADIDIHVVFSTSWRKHKTAEQLSAYIGNDAIPMIFSSLSEYETFFKNVFTDENRLYLIKQYIQSNHISLDDVLILDDMDILYSFLYQNEIMYLGKQFDIDKVTDSFYQKLNQRFLLCETPINEQLAIEGCFKIFN
jgi:hypothetical protein